MKTDAEKYNESVQPNTAFLSELKDRLPEFFNKNGFFDLEKFKEHKEELLEMYSYRLKDLRDPSLWAR